MSPWSTLTGQPRPAPDDLRRLAAAHGVATGYRNERREPVDVDADVVIRVLGLLDVEAGTEAARRAELAKLADAVAIAERIARVAKRARIRVPAAAGALRSRLYAAGAVRSESALEDGSLDMTVELPDVELVSLARTPGVQIVTTTGETPAAAMPCAPEEAYLQSASR